MNRHKKLVVFLLTGLLLVLGLSAGSALGDTPSLVIIPDKTVLSPALIKKPIMITGSGWMANEMVVINLLLPKGVTVKGVQPGEDVGIATGTADAKGVLNTKIGTMTILMTFIQVGWDSGKMKPVFSEAKPLPPGVYNIEAVGLESDKKVKATLTLLPPPKKK